MMTALEAAEILGVDRRTMYDLAAPRGPIPCYRMGRRCVRFEETDLQEYLQSCRHTKTTVTPTADIRSTKALTVTDPAAQNCFQKRRLGRREKPSIEGKTSPGNRTVDD